MIRKFLFLFFVGLPGLAFQAIGGLVAIIYAMAFSSTSGLALWEFGLLLIPVAVFTVGATMQAYFDAIQEVHQSTAEVLAVVLQKTLALLAMVAVSVAIVFLAKGQPGACMVAVLLLVVFCGGFTACVAHRRKLHRRGFLEIKEPDNP